MAYLVIPNDPVYRESRIAAFWSRVSISDDRNACWPWLGWCYGNGYGSFKMKTGKVTTHRFAYEAANGPIPPGLNVLHSCDNRKCCNPNHLRIGTQKENIVEMFQKGRRTIKGVRGEASRWCRFSDEFVKSALDRFKTSGMSQAAFAREIGMSTAQFNKIVNGHSRSPDP